MYELFHFYSIIRLTNDKRYPFGLAAIFKLFPPGSEAARASKRRTGDHDNQSPSGPPSSVVLLT